VRLVGQYVSIGDLGCGFLCATPCTWACLQVDTQCTGVCAHIGTHAGHTNLVPDRHEDIELLVVWKAAEGLLSLWWKESRTLHEKVVHIHHLATL
jgi:hypothetical protein